MKVSMSSAVRTVIAASALGITFAGGIVTGRSVDATTEPMATSAFQRPTDASQHVYYVVDSQQAALDVERAELMTAMERLMVETTAPGRVVHIIDDSQAGRMTAMEKVLLATGNQ